MLNNMKNNQPTPAQIWRAFLANESTELATVAKAVKNQMGLPLADVVENLYSISRHGIAGGYTGFVYYSETVAFWRKNRAKIFALMNYEADSMGENVFAMVRSFRMLGDYTDHEVGRALFGNYCDGLTYIYNVFAWYAAEVVAYRFGEFCYDNNIDPFNL